ncbi:hypothetical protein EHP00_747 [Ecytonucleospora hepatopenaei]|uniref:Uncharacterized protein n=1 Tax=Ecytonucleospora hepatopenaei TaxID=646526 RepID=A0A1W0E3A9_9MICR|nr:hypothetical protein EHP00_747 [Ecytonucleospora hepatopenaei]
MTEECSIRNEHKRNEEAIVIIKKTENNLKIEQTKNKIWQMRVFMLIINLFDVVWSIVCMQKSVHCEEIRIKYSKARYYPLNYLTYNISMLIMISNVWSMFLSFISLANENPLVTSYVNFYMFTLYLTVCMVLTYWPLRFTEGIVKMKDARLNGSFEFFLDLYDHLIHPLLLVANAFLLRYVTYKMCILRKLQRKIKKIEEENSRYDSIRDVNEISSETAKYGFDDINDYVFNKECSFSSCDYTIKYKTNRVVILVMVTVFSIYYFALTMACYVKDKYVPYEVLTWINVYASFIILLCSLEIFPLLLNEFSYIFTVTYKKVKYDENK